MRHVKAIEQAWDFLLENLRQGVWILDSGGLIVRANSVVAKWLECPKLIGTPAASWSSTGTVVTEDTTGVDLVSTSGLVRKVDVVTQKLVDEKGEFIGLVQMMTDQTMVRALEVRLVE